MPTETASQLDIDRTAGDFVYPEQHTFDAGPGLEGIQRWALGALVVVVIGRGLQEEGCAGRPCPCRRAADYAIRIIGEGQPGGHVPSRSTGVVVGRVSNPSRKKHQSDELEIRPTIELSP